MSFEDPLPGEDRRVGEDEQPNAAEKGSYSGTKEAKPAHILLETVFAREKGETDGVMCNDEDKKTKEIKDYTTTREEGRDS